MKLYAKHEDGFHEVAGTPFRSEAELQQLLEQHSNLIPLELDPNQRAIREFPTEAGPIDHLVIDARGTIVVVETKLAKNADRRNVIAQALDYAAQLTKYGPQALLDSARKRAEADFTETWFETRADREIFLRTLETNLRLGKLTLLIVMDHAEQLLKDAVRFINRATHFSCLLAEITVVEVGGSQIVGFDVYGQEMVDEKTPPQPELDRDTFVAIKAETGLAAEAGAFVDALQIVGAEGAETSSSSSGFFLQGKPTLGNHYLAWMAGSKTIAVWAPVNQYEAVKAHLESAPTPWKNRIATKPLRPGGQYGKVADIDATGATSVDEFLVLLHLYLEAPTRSSK